MSNIESFTKLQKETFKDISNYEGYYQVSNLGNVKSLERKVEHSKSGRVTVKEKILKQNIDSRGYLCVCLSKNCNQKTRTVHQLVAESFLEHKANGNTLVCNHINFNKLDNRLENLEIITHRENSNKKHIKSASKYTGVSRYKSANKWRARIWINGKEKQLGYFNNEYDAHIAYQKELNKFKNEKIKASNKSN